MRRIFLLFILAICHAGQLHATHNRAGEITFRQISGYTYEVTITTFTYTQSAANRSQLTVEWGDNTYSIAPLVERTTLPNYYYHNIYTATHTFPGPGIYEIMMQDPNRNYGIQNIPNSVNVIFSIKTTFIISPELGSNSTPRLLNYPIDRATRGHIFIHNPAAYDPDGDSLSYKLTVCTGQDGKPISNYSLPQASDTIYVDAVTGDLVWFSPVDTGKYNIAINVEEWRSGVKIGNIVRDMQIDVFDSDNNPPDNPPLRDYCVLAGSLVDFQVTTTDPDGDSVNQLFTGGPFALVNSAATFKTVAKGKDYSTSRFTWQTTCDHIRKQPYQVILRSEDNNNEVALVDISNFNIRVLAPAPENLQLSSTSAEIDLTWSRSTCGPVSGYYVYRREGPFAFTPDSCENGLPSSTGYVRIATIRGGSDTVFFDDNNGEGLVQGVEYCYRITAWYPDGDESFASDEVCGSLVPGFPSILNVSVTRVDAAAGNIFLSWAKPNAADLAGAAGPFVCTIYRSMSPDPATFVPVDSVLTADLNDTTYTDTLNTTIFPYYYSVRMFNNTPGNRFEMRQGESEIASSLYMVITPGDNQLTLELRKKTPWINDSYIIYRSNPSMGYDSVGITYGNTFVDGGLMNGQTFTYQARSSGWRPIDNVIYRNENLSHLASGTPIDTTAPCPPFLTVVSLCDSFTNKLVWTNPNNSCANDVVRYNIYFASDTQSPLDSLTSTAQATDTIYYHQPAEGLRLAGCYAVTAVDSFENESMFSNKVCVDECIEYELPNVFSPNDDNINDIYLARNRSDGIKTVDMKIYNRYGQLVFETADPDIRWDGRYRNTNDRVPTGVYYYICDVYEPRISGIEVRSLVGFIHLYAEGYAGESTK